MLTFYYHPLSPIAHRVWLALLEMDIDFELRLVDLRGKQFEPEFLALNPFHHVPVIVHNHMRLIESVAILDYLDGQFAAGAFSPKTPAAIAQMRMVQMVVTNELMTKIISVATAQQQPLSPATQAEIDTCMQFLNQHLGENAYFGGERLNLADFVAGATVPLFSRLGYNLSAYPMLQRWVDRLAQRPAWQQIQPSREDFQQWKRWINLRAKRRQRQSSLK